MPAEPAGRNVVLTTGASGVRRALAPTAWMVLEELLLRSNGFGGEFIADESVRALGRSLGLSKDTVARAIRQLHGAGLVTVSQRRTGIGRFESGSYVLALPAGVTLASAIATSRNFRSRSSPEAPAMTAPGCIALMIDRQVPASRGVWSCCG